MVQGGSSDDLTLTPQGQAAFPGLTNTDINAGPWHGHFEGNIGGLQVLVTSSTVDDNQGNDARVVIGGAAVTLPGTISLTPATATNPVGTSHTVTATVRNPDGSPRSGVLVHFSVTSGPDNGKTGTGTTNATGKATFTYTNTGGAGTDTISASYTEGQNNFSATATKTWQGTAPPPTTVHQASGLGKVRSSGTSRVYCYSFHVTKKGSTLSGSAWLGSGRRQFLGSRVTYMSGERPCGGLQGRRQVQGQDRLHADGHGTRRVARQGEFRGQEGEHGIRRGVRQRLPRTVASVRLRDCQVT